MSLRRRIAVGMLLLLVAAIVPADLVTSSYLRSFLTGRLDEQIDVAQEQAFTYIYEAQRIAVENKDTLVSSDPQAWLAQLSTPSNPGCETGVSGSTGQTSRSAAASGSPGNSSVSGSGAVSSSASSAASTAPGRSSDVSRTPRLNATSLAGRLNPDVYVEVITDSGLVAFDDPSGSCTRPDPAPILPKHLPVQVVPLHRVFGRNHGPYVPDRPTIEVAALGEPGAHYRLQAVAVPGGTLVTAISLDPTNQTVSSLTRVEIGVSIVVVLTSLFLVLWIVRFGLRPLYDMTETARAIAAGDLTRRIQRSDERSEVGRLGAALNGMLSQIEAAFRERGNSEGRLRRFVADASHELRTPLTSIRGYAELLRKGAFAEESARKSAAERIEHEAARMSLLVDDLLLLARLDQGRPFDRSPVDLKTIVSDAVDAARAVGPTRSITLDLTSVTVEGDAARLRQVVDNLLRNAEVHTPPGTAVHVALSRHGAWATISVSDEGPGIDREEQTKVFDRFYRGNEARTGGGSGLGLSIVSAIAVAHGGRARLESIPGQGAAFHVELPAAPIGSGYAGGRTTSLFESEHPQQGQETTKSGGPPDAARATTSVRGAGSETPGDDQRRDESSAPAGNGVGDDDRVGGHSRH